MPDRDVRGRVLRARPAGQRHDLRRLRPRRRRRAPTARRLAGIDADPGATSRPSRARSPRSSWPALKRRADDPAADARQHVRALLPAPHASPPSPARANNCVRWNDNESYLDADNTAGDLEPCFENRVTSVVAAYRPLGIFASTDTLDAPLPAGSEVIVDLYVAGETPSVDPADRRADGDRSRDRHGRRAVLQPGRSAQARAAPAALRARRGVLDEVHQFSFETTRPAFRGEQLTFQVQLVGARSWAFGYEGQHASKVTIIEAPLPADGLNFGTTHHRAGERLRGVRGSTSSRAAGTTSRPREATRPAQATIRPPGASRSRSTTRRSGRR